MNKLELGICIKDQEKKVVSQNSQCLNSCGKMVGEICTKGCMSSYVPLPGMTLIKNSTVDGNTLDAVIINDGQTLTTLLYSNSMNADYANAEAEALKAHGLSKSELALFMKVIEGKKNSQIIKELFISKSTLKTHLNNIYKKLPESYQRFKKRQ